MNIVPGIFMLKKSRVGFAGSFYGRKVIFGV